MRKILTITAGIIVAILMFQNCQKSDFLIITGVVRDSITNLPIEGTYIVWQGEHYTRTASDGTFSIEGVKPGKVAFYAISFNGYNPKYTSAIISDGRVNKVNFVLGPIVKPQIETGIVSNITLHTATVAGSLNLKNEVWTQYGFCLSSTNTAPSLTDGNSYYVGSTSSSVNFSYNLTGLASEQIYYVRAYATSDAGTIYGNSVVFRTTEIPVGQGLIGYYSFSGSFTDESGNGNYCYSYNVNYVPDRFGKSNSAMEFNTNYVYSNSSNFWHFDQFSISFWFYKYSWAGSDHAMISNGYPNYTREMRIGEDASPNKLYFDIITGSGTTYKIFAASAPSLNAWHHVVAQRNSTSLELYIDGILQSSASCDNQSIDLPSAYIFFGDDLKGGWWRFFNGKLDDIRIYNRPLTNTEIQYLKTH